MNYGQFFEMLPEFALVLALIFVFAFDFGHHLFESWLLWHMQRKIEVLRYTG